MTGQTLLVLKNAVRQHARLSCKQLLQQEQHSVYTGMRTVGRTAVLRLSQHLERLVTSYCGAVGKVAETTASEAETEQVRQSLLALTQPTLVTALSEAGTLSPPPGEFKVMLVVPVPREVTYHVGCVWAVVEELSVPARDASVDVEIRVAERSDPHIKSADWASDRERWLSAMRPGVNEVVMENADGILTEGMSSNFVVVAADGATLLSSPLDMVLPGTMLQVLQHVCSDQGVVLKYQPILAADAESWSGAFVMSTSRPLLPVRQIVWRDRSDAVTDMPPVSPLMQRLVNAVRDRLHAESEAVLA